jgi:hypothetical protein
MKPSGRYIQFCIPAKYIYNMKQKEEMVLRLYRAFYAFQDEHLMVEDVVTDTAVDIIYTFSVWREVE